VLDPQSASPGGSGAELLREIDSPRRRAARFKRWFKDSHDAFQLWRDRAIESYKFVSGEQWSDEDIVELDRQKRPHLTINKILGPVLFLEGMQRQQRQEPKILPVEGSDVRPAELMGALYKWVGTNSREDVVDSKVFSDKIITGLGYWKLGLDFDDSPEGTVSWERVSPLSVFPDPSFLEVGWKHAKYVIHAMWFSLEDAMERWPDHAEKIKAQFGEWAGGITGGGGGGTSTGAFGGGEELGDSMADARLFWDNETQRVRILEAWYKERPMTEVAVLRETGEVEADPERVSLMREKVEAFEGFSDSVMFDSRPVIQVKVAHILNETLLSDELSPYEDQCFPVFPTIGFHFHRTPMGIVEPMKDPQREKNKRRSVMVDLVKRAPLSGFLNKREGGARNTEITEFANGVGAVINYDQQPPTPIPPPDIPQTLVFLDGRSDQEIRDVVNINNEMMGAGNTRVISGRAIDARQRGGATVQEPMLESFVQDKDPAVRFCISMIQQFMPPETAHRILGTMVVRDPQLGAAPIVQQGQQSPQGMMELQRVLSKAYDERFDVAVGTKPFEPSFQIHRLKVLSELAQQFGSYMPPQVLLNAGKNAGLLTEEDAQMVLQHIAQQQAMQQMTVMGAAQSGSGVPGEALK